MASKDYRSKNGPVSKRDRFVMLEHWVIRSDAWRDLSPHEVRVLLILLERYDGSNNGRIGLSVRQAASVGRMAKGTAQKALRRLEELGFIKTAFKGSFTQKTIDGAGKRYASEYTLTCKKVGEQPATKEFKSWKAPKKKTVPKKGRNSPDLGPMTNFGVL